MRSTYKYLILMAAIGLTLLLGPLLVYADEVVPLDPKYRRAWETTADGGQRLKQGSLSVGGTHLGTGYGLRWNSANDSYVLGSVDHGYFRPSTVLVSFPVQERMRRVILSDAGVVQYALCPTDSTKKADCVTASDLTGTDGQVMVEIPQFHYLQFQDGTYRYFLVGVGQFSFIKTGGVVVNSTIHPVFYKGGSSTPSDYRYVGAYEASMYDASETAMTAVASIHSSLYAAGDKMCSVSGQYPKTAENIVEYRAMAAARGTGWHQYDHATHAALSILYLTEYGSFYSQDKIGNGRVSLTNGDWVASETFDEVNYGYIGKCGLSNPIGNATGADSTATDLTVSESPAYMSYRGIENWWGNVWQFMDGANIHNDTTASKLYLATDHTAYASDTATGYVFAGNLQEVEGYVGDILDALGVWAKTTGGNSATYITDYYYTEFDTAPAGGWRVARVGGSANGGTNAGAFCVDSGYGSSSAYAFIGGRLCF